MYFRLVVVDVDGKLSGVRIDAMWQMQVVVLAPLKMVERWAVIAASLPILADALISTRVGSMVARDGLSEIRLFGLYPSVLFRARCTGRRAAFGVRCSAGPSVRRHKGSQEATRSEFEV